MIIWNAQNVGEILSLKVIADIIDIAADGANNGIGLHAECGEYVFADESNEKGVSTINIEESVRGSVVPS